jgi:hypothetical protein
MREVITYVAYDGAEFDNRKECEAYESEAFNLLDEIFNSLEFFLDNGQEIQIYLNDIESGINAFAYAWGKCSYISVTRTLSEEANDFIQCYFGFTMPPNERGFYGFDLHDGWFRMG